MDKYYLAVDIGASSGRHMLASMKDGKMQLEEVYRFPNGMENRNGTLCWDVERLFNEIKTGLKKCKELGKIPATMGIDTWGVDYVLLDKDDQILGETVGYRDSRTDGMDEKVYEKISPEDLYARTGIQKQVFNTIYQLMAVKQSHPEYLEQAEKTPDHDEAVELISKIQIRTKYDRVMETIEDVFQNSGKKIPESEKMKLIKALRSRSLLKTLIK